MNPWPQLCAGASWPFHARKDAYKEALRLAVTAASDRDAQRARVHSRSHCLLQRMSRQSSPHVFFVGGESDCARGDRGSWAVDTSVNGAQAAATSLKLSST